MRSRARHRREPSIQRQARRERLSRLAVVGVALGMAGLLSLIILTQPPSALIVLIGAVLGLLVVVRWPTKALMAAVLSRILVDLLWWLDWSLGGVNFMELYTGAVGVVVLLLTLTNLERLQRHPLFVPILVFLGVLGVATVAAVDLRNGIEYAFRFSLPFLLLLLVGALFDQRQVWRLLRLGILVGTIPLLLSLYNLAEGHMVSNVRLDYDRAQGAYGSLHAHGHMMVAFSIISLVAAEFVKSRRLKLLLHAYTAIALTNLFFSHVRTAQLSFVVFALLYYGSARKTGHLLALLLGGVALLMVSESARSSFSDIPSLFFYDPVATDINALGSGRVAIWRTAISRFFAKPAYYSLLGLGLDNHILLSTSGYLDTHSDFLGLFFQTGLIGLSTYAYLFFQAIRRALRLIRDGASGREKLIGRATLGYLGAAILSNSISNAYLSRVTPSWLLWLLVGISFVLPLARESTQGSEEAQELAS